MTATAADSGTACSAVHDPSGCTLHHHRHSRQRAKARSGLTSTGSVQRPTGNTHMIIHDIFTLSTGRPPPHISPFATSPRVSSTLQHCGAALTNRRRSHALSQSEALSGCLSLPDLVPVFRHISFHVRNSLLPQRPSEIQICLC